jgi:hypothetical protein
MGFPSQQVSPHYINLKKKTTTWPTYNTYLDFSVGPPGARVVDGAREIGRDAVISATAAAMHAREARIDPLRLRARLRRQPGRQKRNPRDLSAFSGRLRHFDLLYYEYGLFLHSCSLKIDKKNY